MNLFSSYAAVRLDIQWDEPDAVSVTTAYYSVMRCESCADGDDVSVSHTKDEWFSASASPPDADDFFPNLWMIRSYSVSFAPWSGDREFLYCSVNSKRGQWINPVFSS